MLSAALTSAIKSAFLNLSTFARGIVHELIGAISYVATEIVNERLPIVFGILASGITS